MRTPIRLEDCGLLLTAHGDGTTAPRTSPPNRSLLSHRQTLATSGKFSLVQAGVLSGAPNIDNALKHIRQQPDLKQLLVFPLFMAQGYFVQTVLVQRLQEADLSIPTLTLPPLGNLPGLPALILKEAHKMIAQQSSLSSPERTRLLVVGHGSSKSRASAQSTHKMVSDLASRSSFATVDACFLEEPPFLTDALKTSSLPTIVSGFFTGDGIHGANDIPEAIRITGSNAYYTGAIGTHYAIPKLILEAAKILPQASL